MASSELKLVVNPQSMASVNALVDAVRSAISESDLSESFKQLLDRFLDGPNLADKLIRIEADLGSAGAGELLVSLHPTDFFRGLPAAIRAGNIDGLVVENGHSESPVGL